MAEILNDGHSVGLEKEFYVVDGTGSTYRQSILEGRIVDRMQAEMDAYDGSVGPKCYEDGSGPLEVVTRPCTNLHQLNEDVTTAYRIAQEEADSLNCYALGMGIRPGQSKDKAGLHVHVGYADEGEARYVFYALQRHVPDIVALSANSPIRSGKVKDVRLIKGSYGLKVSPYSSTSNSSVIQKRSGTIEVRCMDSQGSGEEDTAIAAYIFGIAEKAKDVYHALDDVPPEADVMYDVSSPYEVLQKELVKNRDRAIKQGMVAVFKTDGEEVPAYRVVADTLEEIRPYLERYDCPADVITILEDKVEHRRSGADDVLDIYREMEREKGLDTWWQGVKRFFKKDDGLFGPELYDRIAHRE
ncbi:MAG: glutamate-cysteine ligase family protein [Methanopyri archaeon]|jgi:hypothetical protein|nr:glutamate-cysteine ligase family protein [Methanopyri archaeon]